MNNRLGDLGSTTGVDENDVTPVDVKMADLSAMKQPRHMEYFFGDVEKVKFDIKGIGTATRKSGDIDEQALQATTSDEENQLSKLLRTLIHDTNKCAKRTKTLLGLLKEENKKLQDNGQVSASDLRYELSNCE
jgi:hypothetical protein